MTYWRSQSCHSGRIHWKRPVLGLSSAIRKNQAFVENTPQFARKYSFFLCYSAQKYIVQLRRIWEYEFSDGVRFVGGVSKLDLDEEWDFLTSEVILLVTQLWWKGRLCGCFDEEATYVIEQDDESQKLQVASKFSKISYMRGRDRNSSFCTHNNKIYFFPDNSFSDVWISKRKNLPSSFLYVSLIFWN